MKQENERLYEYRVTYNAGKGHSAMDSAHYYQAYSARQAFNFHESMMNKHGFRAQLVKIERYCPYSLKWIEEPYDTNR